MTPTIYRPTVVIALATFGDRVLQAAERTLPSPLPRLLQVIRAGEDPVARIQPALTAALSTAPKSPASFLTQRVTYQAPLTVVIAPAAELSGVVSVAKRVEAIRCEYRRSCLAGRVMLLLYAGPVGGRVPEDAVLREFDRYDLPDTRLIFTDSDSVGRRLFEDQAANTAGLFLAHFLTNGELQARAATYGSGRQLAFGTARADATDGSVRGYLRGWFRAEVRDALYGPSPDGESLESLDAQALEDVQRRGQPLRSKEAAAVRMNREFEWQLAASQLRDTEEETRQALEALLPPSRPLPPPYRSFWRRVWEWIKSLFGWRRPVPPRPKEPEPYESESPVRAEQLARAERFRIIVGWMNQALAVEDEPPFPAIPYELALADLPGVQERTLRRFGQLDREELLRLLDEEFPLAEVLNDDRLPESFLVRIDALCDRMLRLDERPRVVNAEDYREIAAAIEPLVAPLFCGRGGVPLRFACVPLALRETFPAADAEVIPGRDGEVVFFVLQPDVSLCSLMSEEGHEDADGPVPGPVTPPLPATEGGLA